MGWVGPAEAEAEIFARAQMVLERDWGLGSMTWNLPRYMAVSKT